MKPSDRDIQQLMKLTLKLKEVQDQKAALEEEEAQLKDQIRACAAEVGASPQRDDSTGASAESTLASAVVKVLDKEPTVEFTADAISHALDLQGHTPKSEMDSIRSTLARLAKKDRIVSVRRGLYQSVNRPAAAPASPFTFVPGRPPIAHGTKQQAPAGNGKEVCPTL